MIKYIFEIDKNAAFAYVIQSLINWSWFFSSAESNYYVKTMGGLSEQESITINDFGKFLKKKNKGSYLLWKLYSSQKFLSPTDYFRWKKIRNTFAEKFDKVWAGELPKLEIWKQELESYDFSDINNVLDKISKFLGNGKLNKTIKVKLLPYPDTQKPNGHAHRGFKDVIVLNISNLDRVYKNKLISTFTHEIAHLIEYSSPLVEKLLKKTYAETILPLNLERGKVSWRYLFAESLISAIAGNRIGNNYINYKIFYEEFRPVIIDNKKNKEDIIYKMKAVSFRIAEITKNYLDSSRVIDKNFCNYLAKEWRKAITDKNYLNNIPYEKVSF